MHLNLLFLSLHRPTDTDAGTPVVGGTTILSGYRMEAHRLETPRLQEDDMQDGGGTFPRHQRRAGGAIKCCGGFGWVG